MYQEDVVAILLEQEPTATREEALAFMNEFDQEEYGTTGFIAYVQSTAEAGISINRATSSSDSGGLNLSGGLAYAFWVVEALVMFGLAASTALKRARGETAPKETTAAAA